MWSAYASPFVTVITKGLFGGAVYSCRACVLSRVNVDVSKTLVQQMAGVLEEKLASDPEAASAGLVVNSMGWVEGSGYQVRAAARGMPLGLVLAADASACLPPTMFCPFSNLLFRGGHP